jgi:hypothetical protein
MPAVQTVTGQPQCTYPLVGVEALLAHLRSTAAELRDVSRRRHLTFSWNLTLRERELASDLASKVSAYSIVTGQPEPVVTALLAA